MLLGPIWEICVCIFDRAILLLFQMIVLVVLVHVSYKLFYCILFDTLCSLFIKTCLVMQESVVLSKNDGFGSMHFSRKWSISM